MEERPRAWHVSAWVDMLGYHWSFVPPLVAMAFIGDRFPVDFSVALLAAWALNFSHQAISLAIVYGDGRVLETERRRFTVLPLALILGFVTTLLSYHRTIPPLSIGPWELAAVPAAIALFVQLDRALRLERASPWWAATVALFAVPWFGAVVFGGSGALVLSGIAAASLALAAWSRRDRPFAGVLVAVALVAWVLPLSPLLPEAPVRFRVLLNPLYAVAYAWNFWHIYMQKYGILRLHAAKSGVPLELRTPGWVDRLLVFGWLPLIVVVAGVRNVELIKGYFVEVRAVSDGLARVLVEGSTVLTIVSASIALASVVLFVRYERRAVSAPRVSAGLAMIVVSLLFLVMNPVKVAIAFGISHTVEYFVFVWAWQRRKFASADVPPSPMRTLMRRPAVAVFGFAIGAAAFWLVIETFFRSGTGVTPRQALAAFAPFLAITHFYFDGFLWKMRKPSVRAHL